MNAIAVASRRALLFSTVFAISLLAGVSWPTPAELTPLGLILPIAVVGTGFALAVVALGRLTWVLRRAAARIDKGADWEQVRAEQALDPSGVWRKPIWWALWVFSFAWLAIPLAARGWLTPVTVWVFAMAPVGIVVMASRRAGVSGAGAEANPPPAKPASYLRGPSVWALLSMLGGTISVSALLFLGSLPIGLSRYIPERPNPAEEGSFHSEPAAAFTGPASASVEAADALHNLVFAGSPQPVAALEAQPTRRHAPWWPLETPIDLGHPPETWAETLLPALLRGDLTPDQIDAIRRLADHPAHHEFDVIARAGTVRVADGRWKPGLDSALTVFEFPVPRYLELWNGVRGRIATSALLAHDGQWQAALQMSDELVSLGQQLAHRGPSPADPEVGTSIAQEGQQARTTIGELWPLDEDVPASPHTLWDEADGGTGAGGAPSVWDRVARVSGHQRAARNPSAPLAFRLEGFAVAETFAPCQSLRNVLWFDPPPAPQWEGFGDRVQEVLGVYRLGLLGTRGGVQGWGPLPLIFASVMGTRGAVTHCLPTLIVLKER